MLPSDVADMANVTGVTGTVDMISVANGVNVIKANPHRQIAGKNIRKEGDSNPWCLFKSTLI